MAIKMSGGSLITRPKEEQQQEQPAAQVKSEVVDSIASLGNEAANRIVQPAFREQGRKKEAVNHPAHYGGKDNPYEVIKVIRAWELNFTLGNVVKYLVRAGRKDPSKKLEDLHKAMWYLQEEIANEYERSVK